MWCDDHVRWDGPDGYWASDDPALIDAAQVHRWISEEAYWAKGRPRATMDAAIRNSLSIGLYRADGSQAGYARVVTDYATFGWLCDVFIAADERGRGLGSFLTGVTVEPPRREQRPATTCHRPGADHVHPVRLHRPAPQPALDGASRSAWVSVTRAPQTVIHETDQLLEAALDVP